MNTKRLVITAASLSLSSLMFSNCASIKELREREDPYSTAKKKKVEKVATKKKKGGLFGFLSNLRKGSNDKNTPTKATANALANKTKSTATVNITKTTSKPAPRSNYNSLPTLPIGKVTNPESTAVKGQRRRVIGLMTPDAGKLPSNKDLQEVQAPSSRKKGTPGVNIPTQP